MTRATQSFIAFFSASIFVSGICAQPKVVINELMYAPRSPEPEWIEILNNGTDTIGLSGWHISNHSRIEHIPTVSIAPNGLMVLTHDSTKLRAKYPSITSPIIQMTMPSLNNSGDSITLRDSANNIVDQVNYDPSWGGSSGRSLERFDAGLPSTQQNFFECTDTAGATPGAPNSTRRRDHDVASSAITVVSNSGTSSTLHLITQNRGRQAESHVTYSLYRSNSSIPIVTGSIENQIAPLAFDSVQFIWENADLGNVTLQLISSLPNDEYILNDTAVRSIYIPIPKHAVVINELMIVPAFSYSQWIEIYNQTSSTCDLSGTTLKIPMTDTSYSYPIGSLKLGPKGFGLIAATTKYTSVAIHPTDNADTVHTTSFHLAASGSSIVFLNADSSVIDSVAYDASFISQNLASSSGISLERRHPDGSSSDKNNWGSCVAAAGSTPLAPNSILFDSLNTNTALSVAASPNPFSPDNDGFEDKAIITLSVPTDNEQTANVRIYDARSRLRRTLGEQMRFVREATMEFDGNDDHGVPLELGLYTLVATTGSNTIRKGIVIAKRK